MIGLDSNQPFDDGDLRTWEFVYWIRHVASFLLGVAAVVVSSVGRHHVLIGVTLLLGVFPFGVGLHWYTRHTRTAPRALAIVDPVVGFIIAAIFPALWPAALVVTVSSLALSAAAFGVGFAGLLGGLCVATSATAAVVTGDHGLTIGAIGFAAAVPVVVGSVGSLSQRERVERRRQTDLLDRVGAVLWEADAIAGTYTFVSKEAERILGYPVAHWFTPGFWAARVHPDDLAAASLLPVAKAGELGLHERDYRMLTADGRWIWLRDKVQIEPGSTGSGLLARGVKIEVTAEHERAEALERFADIVENIRTGLLVFAFDDIAVPESLRVIGANRAAGVLRHFEPAAIIGRLASEVFPTFARDGFIGIIHGVATSNEPQQRDVFPDRSPDQGPIYAFGAFPLPGGIVGLSFDDITERRRAELALRRQATFDSLTGLGNRALILSRLAALLPLAEREGRQLALLLMDLNQFKEVNDSLGHHIGDRLLQELGARLFTSMRRADTVARLGGDEFAVLLSTDVSAENAVLAAQRIVKDLEQPFVIDGMTIQTGASIGIALYPHHGEDADALFQHADVAMYIAKRSALGYSVYTSTLDSSSVQRVTLIGEIRSAIEDGQFELVYQPIIDVATGTVIGAEALSRWHHPELGLLLPQDFVRLAEVSGSIRPLTRWVIGTAVKQARTWQVLGHPVRVAVNVSVRNLFEAEFVDWLVGTLNEHKLDPSLFQIEITESEIMEDVPLTRSVLMQLGELGINLSIDDFGTGFSSLSHLRQLHVDEIKIDRSFVSNIGTSENDAVIVQSMVNLAHNLGLLVVAEGIEDGGTYAALSAMGCDKAQGYYFNQPINGSEFVRWINGWMSSNSLSRVSVTTSGQFVRGGMFSP